MSINVKKRVLNRLKGVENYLQDKPGTIFHLDLQTELQNEILSILDQEELLWRTKSRLDWCTQGERNTTFFHRTVQIRRHKSRILSLQNSVGEDISDPTALSDHIRSFYCTLFTSEASLCSTLYLDLAITPTSTSLCHSPSLIEVKNALFAMKPLKAPGPDGFHPLFFQKSWETISHDLHLQISECFKYANVPEHLCNALICLIPKVEHPTTVKQLRPISLCNTIYKVITKIIVQRLKPIMPNWISPNQNGFIKGRGPEVNIVVATEILHSMNKKKGKKGWFALKIDLEKAYDRIEWHYLRECLVNLNLDIHSIRMIMNCVTQASSTVLVNGCKTHAFPHSRGLRQGDPLSPYLFNICLEQLTNKINLATESKDWTPFWVGRKKIPISHLLFADDLLLFGRVDENTAFAVRDTLATFCNDSGQKINEQKSGLLFSPNTP